MQVVQLQDMELRASINMLVLLTKKKVYLTEEEREKRDEEREKEEKESGEYLKEFQ